jgi:hypothetical protein
MANEAGPGGTPRTVEERLPKANLPLPSLQFRLRAWREFQRALDPFARPKPLRRPPP